MVHNQAKARSITAFKLYQLDVNKLSDVEYIAGDISAPLFGLSHDQYCDLSQRVSIIFHCAAYVNHVLPYQALRATNVIGTKNVQSFMKDPHSFTNSR
jgi:thioester reductase-like protein